MDGSFSILETVKRYWIYVILGILAVNSLLLDFFYFFPKSQPRQAVFLENVNLSSNTSETPKSSCPQSCLNQIGLTFKSQKASDSPVAILVSSTPVPAAPTPTIALAKTVKEFFVPLGTGTGKSADWTAVDGIEAKIDPADYGNVKQVTFEVTAFIPTGNQIIWIRLYNANTYQAVAGSEVTLSGGAAKLLTSSPITLSSGNNLYQVQLKTQLQYPANIDMARIRIKTN